MVLCYLTTVCACKGMPDHTQLKQHNQFIATIDVSLHFKNQLDHLTLTWDIIMQSDNTRVFWAVTWKARIMPDMRFELENK